MKKQLIVYALLIVLYLVYNFFFKLSSEKANTAVNIIFASLIFGYISYLAITLLRIMKRRK